MDRTSTAPYPYQRPYMDNLEPAVREFGFPHWSTYMSFPAIDDGTDTSWVRLEIILAGVTALAQQHGWNASFGLPARLEFTWDNASDRRGVLIYDSRGQLIVHVVHALLGYSGSGPALSEQILSALGAQELFAPMNQAARDRAYVLVASRQPHGTIQGVDTAIPGMDVEQTWTWWRAR